jgi:hypothetical protein
MEAAMDLEHPLTVEPDQLDTLSVVILSVTGFGLMRGNSLLNWGAWFLLITFYINRASTKSWFSQSLFSLVMVTVSTGIMYWRMMNGSIPLPK